MSVRDRRSITCRGRGTLTVHVKNPGSSGAIIVDVDSSLCKYARRYTACGLRSQTNVLRRIALRFDVTCNATALQQPRALKLVCQAGDMRPSTHGVSLNLHVMPCNSNATSSFAASREYFFTSGTVDPQGGLGVLSMVCRGVRSLQ